MNTFLKNYAAPISIIIFALILLVLNLFDLYIPTNYLEKGINAFEKNNYIDAIKYNSRAVRNAETDIAAHFYLGASYHNYGWHDEALKQYEAVWEISKDYCTRSMHSAARIFAANNDYNRAKIMFDRALALSPEAAGIWYEYGVLNIRFNYTNNAIYCARRAVDIAPQNQMYKNLLDLCSPKQK